MVTLRAKGKMNALHSVLRLFLMGLNGQSILTTKCCKFYGCMENCNYVSLLSKIHIGFKDELEIITFTILIILPIGFPQVDSIKY